MSVECMVCVFIASRAVGNTFGMWRVQLTTRVGFPFSSTVTGAIQPSKSCIHSTSSFIIVNIIRVQTFYRTF